MSDITNGEQGQGGAIDLRSYDSFAHELVGFQLPAHSSEADSDLVRDIVVLDHRSLHSFGVHSRPRAEVKALLQNAVIVAGYVLFHQGVATGSTEVRDTRAAIGLYAQAQAIFLRYLQSINRLWYVAGVVLGTFILVIVAFGVRFLPATLAEAVAPGLLTTLIFFAGLGSLVSVLLRLSKIDLANEVLRLILVISGAGRPFVAGAFALVVYLLLSNKLIAVTLTSESVGTYCVIAFLCGFSERFAQDLLGRVSVTDPPSPEAGADRRGSGTTAAATRRSGRPDQARPRH